MLIIVSYDVATSTEDGEKRLRHVAKICQKYGQRVQNSVFECQVEAVQLLGLRAELLKAMNAEHDSLRFYFLGNRYDAKVEHYGVGDSRDLRKDTLMV